MVLPPTYLTRRHPQRVFKYRRNKVYRNREMHITELEKYIFGNPRNTYFIIRQIQLIISEMVMMTKHHITDEH